jgi:hypothetical protein
VLGIKGSAATEATAATNAIFLVRRTVRLLMFCDVFCDVGLFRRTCLAKSRPSSAGAEPVRVVLFALEGYCRRLLSGAGRGCNSSARPDTGDHEGTVFAVRCLGRCHQGFSRAESGSPDARASRHALAVLLRRFEPFTRRRRKGHGE